MGRSGHRRLRSRRNAFRRWALDHAIGLASLAGVLPRAQAVGINRELDEEYCEKLVK